MADLELVRRQPIITIYRCTYCNSANIYYRIKKGDCVCRKCGNVFTVLRPSTKKGG